MQRAGASAGVRLPDGGDPHGPAGLPGADGERGLPGRDQRARPGAAEAAAAATQDPAAHQRAGDAPVQAG